MADTKLTIFQSDATTAAIDYRTESTNGDGRQVIVLGDPSSNNAVAAVQATDPSSNTEGLVVRDVNTSAIVSRLGSTLFVQLDPGHELGTIKGSNSSIAVYFDRGNPSVNINSQTSTLNVQLDPGHTIGNIGTINSITNTVAVFFSPANPSVNATFSSASMEVVPTTGSRKTMDDAHAAQRVLIVGSQTAASLTINGTVTANAGTGSMTVQFDPGHELGTIRGNSNTLTVFIPDTGHTLGKVDAGLGTFNVQLDPGHELGSIKGINNSINVYLGATAGTLAMSLKPGTIAVSLDPGFTLGKVDQGNRTSSGAQGWLVDEQGTASIFTASGSASGVSVSGNTIISPSANASFKVFAFSIQTTGQVSLTTKFTNGAGTSPTEYWRPLITASGVTGAQGANLSTGGGGKPLFVTGTNTTLSLVLDSATLVHYSVAYTKESA